MKLPWRIRGAYDDILFEETEDAAYKRTQG